jgi:hypothetical protein
MSERDRRELIEKIAAFLRGQKSLNMTFEETEAIAERLLRFVIDEEYMIQKKGGLPWV